MPLPDKALEKQLTLGYLGVIAARAGFVLESVRDSALMDGIFIKLQTPPDAQPYPTNKFIGFTVQLMDDFEITDGQIHFRLPAARLTELAETNQCTASEQLFILMALPGHQPEWMRFFCNHEALSERVFWTIIKAKNHYPGDVTMKIPLSQHLTPETLTKLYKTAYRGAIADE